MSTSRQRNPDKTQHHIHLAPGQVGRYVLIPGAPERVEVIAKYLDTPVPMAYHREYKSINGTIDGQTVTVISSGIGGPSTAIALEELAFCGADTFIRVGTCGGMQPNVNKGDIIIATAAIRAEGTSREYMPLDFPAVANFDVTCALRDAALHVGCTPHIGVVHCKDSFYGQHEPQRMPVHDMLLQRWQAWKTAGCLASEMESAAMFTIASTLGVRAGTVLYCAGNQDAPEPPQAPITTLEHAIQTAIEAVRLLIQKDAQG